MIYFLILISHLLYIRAHKIHPPTIDGEIDSIWAHADSITTFIQWSPYEGETPTGSTKVHIGYDEKNIYILFQCYDSQQEKLSINVVPRDCVSGGDMVWVMIDPFNDKNTAYDFGVNASGVQLDTKHSQDGRETDLAWDGVWYSAVEITNYGYNVEMKIPFKTLKFKPGLTEWGINFSRYVSRKDECASWAPLKQTEGIRVSRCVILKGIQPGKQGLHIEVYPVVLAMYEPHSIHPKAGLVYSCGFHPYKNIFFKFFNQGFKISKSVPVHLEESIFREELPIFDSYTETVFGDIYSTEVAYLIHNPITSLFKGYFAFHLNLPGKMSLFDSINLYETGKAKNILLYEPKSSGKMKFLCLPCLYFIDFCHNINHKFYFNFN